MEVFNLCGVRQNLYVLSLYRNLDLDDRIFDRLLTSMATVQTEDIRASFLFVGDLNGMASSGVVGFYHHEPKWSCSF